MASRRQEFMALGKWICQLRPVGKLHAFTVKGANAREMEISFGGLDNFRGSVTLASAQLIINANNVFALMTLFDKHKISFNEVVRLKGLLKNLIERRK